MTKSINRVGIVGAVILIAMILLSSSGLGYSWEPTEHTRAYWDNDRSSASLDAVQVVNVFNGNGLQIYSMPITGGTWGYPEDIHIGGHEDDYLIFHSMVTLYLYWGDQEPDRPDNCVETYVQATLELQKLVGSNWITTGATGTHETEECKRSTPGTTVETQYLHVWNDTTTSSYANMDLYRLVLYEVGGWIDDEAVKHPDESPVTDYLYYRIKIP